MVRMMKAFLLVASGAIVQGASVRTDFAARKLLFGPMPSQSPTASPTFAPTTSPTPTPTFAPTTSPTPTPTFAPTYSPTYSPTFAPTYSPTFAPTYAPTKSPTKPSLETGFFDIFTLQTVGGGGRAYQFAGLYDTYYPFREYPLEKYQMRYYWKNIDGTFGNFFVRDSSSKVFPKTSPPITDGFGTWTVSVSTEPRDVDGKLPAVPAADAICQQDANKILGTEPYCNAVTGCTRENSLLYCNAADESLVYGRATGGLAAADFTYIFDFCPTGLRGGRDYVVLFSPIDTEERFAECPYRCDPAAPGFHGTNTGQPWTDENGVKHTGTDEKEDLCFGLDPITGLVVGCTNKADNSDGPNGRKWVGVDLSLSSRGWVVPKCCEYGTTTVVPTAVCDVTDCFADRTDLAMCATQE